MKPDACRRWLDDQQFAMECYFEADWSIPRIAALMRISAGKVDRMVSDKLPKSVRKYLAEMIACTKDRQST